MRGSKDSKRVAYCRVRIKISRNMASISANLKGGPLPVSMFENVPLTEGLRRT